jgi:hypothetical protein
MKKVEIYEHDLKKLIAFAQLISKADDTAEGMAAYSFLDSFRNRRWFKETIVDRQFRSKFHKRYFPKI